jgi:hypothetical protein
MPAINMTATMAAMKNRIRGFLFIGNLEFRDPATEGALRAGP